MATTPNVVHTFSLPCRRAGSRPDEINLLSYCGDSRHWSPVTDEQPRAAACMGCIWTSPTTSLRTFTTGRDHVTSIGDARHHRGPGREDKSMALPIVADETYRCSWSRLAAEQPWTMTACSTPHRRPAPCRISQSGLPATTVATEAFEKAVSARPSARAPLLFADFQRHLRQDCRIAGAPSGRAQSGSSDSDSGDDSGSGGSESSGGSGDSNGDAA